MLIIINQYLVCTYQFKETLGSGVIVASLIEQVLLAHLIHTQVHMGHELAHTLTNISLK